MAEKTRKETLVEKRNALNELTWQEDAKERRRSAKPTAGGEFP